MDEIPISKFKASCTALVRQVRRTRKPIRITRFGEAMADLVPPAGPSAGKRWLGSMAGTVQIHGDIVGPVTDEDEWEALAE